MPLTEYAWLAHHEKAMAHAYEPDESAGRYRQAVCGQQAVADNLYEANYLARFKGHCSKCRNAIAADTRKEPVW